MIAICVGHSRPGDSGAVSCGGVSERFANGRLAKQIRAKLEEHDLECDVIDSYQGANYSQAMRWLGNKLTTLKATAAIELHFNFGEQAAHGHEWLHWHSSVGGRYLAQALNRSMSSAFPDHQARGLQAVTAKGRGAGFLCCTPCPAVICEPFFGSNPREWAWFSAYQPALAHAIAAGVAEWNKGGRQ